MFLATNKNSQKYAIKTFSTTKKDEEDITTEIKIWEKLQKSEKVSSLPNFYGSFKEELQSKTQLSIEYYLVFDYFPKTVRDVIDKLRNDKPIPLTKIIHFTKSLISTLAYLQTLQVCHRDLKPENLLVDKKCEHIFVIDFSEAKQVLNYNTTIMKTLAGTPKYLSPELFRVYQQKKDSKLKKINFFKSDVFSFGLVLLELGCLEMPERDDEKEKYSLNIRRLIKKFRKIYEEMSVEESLEKELNDLLEILTVCLEVDSTERPNFIKLYFKMMGMWSDDNFVIREEVQKMILINEH